MKTQLAVALLVLAAGCVQSLPMGAERPPNEADLATIDAVSVAWREAGFPWTAECRQERRDRMVVIRTDYVSVYCAADGPCCGTPERQDACGCSIRTGGWGCAAATTTFEADWVQPVAGLSDHWRVMFWLSEFRSPYLQAKALAHETVHWLGSCSVGDPDRVHLNHPEWWGGDGFESAGYPEAL